MAKIGLLQRIHMTQDKKETLKNTLLNLSKNNKYVVQDKYIDEFQDIMNIMKEKNFDTVEREHDGVNIKMKVKSSSKNSSIQIDMTDDYSDTVIITVDEANFLPGFGINPKPILGSFTLIDTLKGKENHDKRLRNILEAFKWFMSHYFSLIEETEAELKDMLCGELESSNYARGRNSVLKVRNLKNMIQDGVNGKQIYVKQTPKAKPLDVSKFSEADIYKLMNKSYSKEISSETKVLMELLRNAIPSVDKKEDAIMERLNQINDGDKPTVSRKNAVILTNDMFEFHFYNDSIEISIIGKNRKHIGRFAFNKNGNRRFYIEMNIGYSTVETFGLEPDTVIEFMNAYKILRKNWTDIFASAFDEYEKTLKKCLVRLADDIDRLEEKVCQADADEIRNQRIIENILMIGK